MPSIEKNIDLRVPVRIAYSQGTQFEEFPRFVAGLKEVRHLDPKHLQWRATIGGKEVHWTAEITQQVPDKRITWRSASGAFHAGTITFAPLGDAECRLTVHIEYEPEGTSSALDAVAARISADLTRFKEFAEARGRESVQRQSELHGGRAASENGAAHGKRASL